MIASIKKFCADRSKKCPICKMAEILGLLKEYPKSANIFEEMEEQAKIIAEIIKFSKEV